MFWIILILVSGLLSALAGWSLGGIPAALFLGALGVLLTLAARDIVKHHHAIFAGTLIAGVTGIFFGGVPMGVPVALLAFLLLLAIHDHLLQKDVLLPLGLAVMLVTAATTWSFLPPELTIAMRGAIASAASLIGFLVCVGFWDYHVQRTHTIRRNFPVIGWCRYGFELIGDELRQYWFMNNREELPFNRITRRYLYRSGKGLNNNLGFGTEEPYREVGKLHLLNSGFPIHDNEMGSSLPRLVIGKDRRVPWLPSWPIGIAHMSWGSLSEEAVRALSSGAALADIHMGTGEGGLTPYHLEGVVKRVPFKTKMRHLLAQARYYSTFTLTAKPVAPVGEKVGGAKIVVEIGPALFGFKRFIMDPFVGPVGRGFRKVWTNELDWEKLAEVALNGQIVAFEVKGGQGAKPGQGGKLPKEKITPELAEFRGVPMNIDCYSPNAWKEFKTVAELIAFISRIQEVTGKPVGYKTPVGTDDFVRELAKLMKETGKGPDFITIDGGEGGTGAAPVALADTVALPLLHAIPLVDNALREFGVRDRVALIGSGQIAKGSDIVIAMCMGLDMVHIARAFLIAGVGCIMALRCQTNRCPVGVATQDPRLRRGLDPQDKYVKTANYAMVLQREILMLCKALGVRHPWLLSRRNLSVVSEPMVSKKLSEVHPYPDDGLKNFELAPALPPEAGKHDQFGPQLIKLGLAPSVRPRLTPG